MRLFVWVSVITLCGAGCATTNRIAIGPKAQSALGSAQPVVGLDQQEIAADINRSNISAATGGGLIFALVDAAVDSAQAKKAEAAVTPVRDALLDYNFGARFSGDLADTLRDIPWLKGQKVVVQSPASPDLVKEWVDRSPADGLLLLRTRYRFSPDFKAITILVDATLLARSAALAQAAATKRDGVPATFANSFGVVLPLPDAGKLGRDQAAAKWAEGHGAAARAALDLGAREMAAMIAFDLEQPQDDPSLTKSAATVTAPMVMRGELVGAARIKAMVVRTGEGRSWVRAVTGELWSVPAT